jgi:hypothetical protein
MPKARKTKRIKLTKHELNLLAHPPTEGTWICPNHKKDDGASFTVTNSGSQKECWFCHKPRSAKAKKPWKDYELVCSKLGVEAGTPWRVIQQLMLKKEEE